MSFRSVDARFWTDPKVRALSEGERYLFLYFITCPASHYSGVFYIPVPTICFETGIPEKEVRHRLDTLSAGCLVHYDEENSVAFVTNLAKFQIVNKSMASGLKKHFDENIQGLGMIAMFFERYPDFAVDSGYPVDTLPTPSPDGGGHGVGLRDTDTDRDRDRDRYTGNTPVAVAPARPQKKQFGEKVLLTPEEYDRLLADFGKEKIDAMIIRLDGYLGQILPAEARKKYHDHNRTIRNWFRRDGEQSGGKSAPAPDGCRKGAEPGKYDKVGVTV